MRYNYAVKPKNNQMAQNEKVWHPKFVQYMEFIVGHANYKDLPIKRDANKSLKWIATAKSDVGIRRKMWAEAKATELGIKIEPGVYAKVMYAIHPTKIKVCQICGESMSIGYIYPNANLAKAIKKNFDIDIRTYESIYGVWDKAKGIDRLAEFIKLINQKFDTNFTQNDGKEKILEECEALCRLGGKSHLGPGAMSNFPDRYDGFHTYNRCHRAQEDTGRSKDNLKSYTRDRRAYEYWSDGNIQAANQFMGSGYFNGSSADHIGPISLGFVHDPRYLRMMSGSDNSTKRDRLSKETVEEVIKIHKNTGVYPMSWYSSVIWDFIVSNYHKNLDKISDEYRNLLKQNMANYMYILKLILDSGEEGSDFLIATLIAPKRTDFMYNYKFDELGNIISKERRNITERASGEFARFARIALDSVKEYSTKSNRNISADLNRVEASALNDVISKVTSGDYSNAYMELKTLVRNIQTRLIS